mgnify:CR=1 FL=1
MIDEYEHIHMATNERLAEMVDTLNGLLSIDGGTAELLAEVSKRLKTPIRERFNSEAFDIQ